MAPILVGDPIVSMRALGPDPCGVLPAPVAVVGGVSAAASSLGPLPATWYLAATYLTPWGETNLSPEVIANLTVLNPSATVQAPVVPGATALRVYYGLQSRNYAQYHQFDLSNQTLGSTFTATISAYGSPAIAPRNNSAFLPDSDGGFVSSGTAYRWLNQALAKMVVQLGGIRDVSGIAWPSGAAWAVMSQRWTEIENIWWSGWYQWIGRQEYTWLQNPITSVPGYATHWSNAGRDMMGLWPQPGTGPGTSTLQANMGLNDTSALVATVGGFTLPGMFQIDDEFILASSFTGTAPQTMIGIIRGVGGTVNATHANGATVTQLITMFAGTRLSPQFSPGSAYTMLQLPAGWEVPIDRYMLARYREKEQQFDAASAEDQNFNAWIETLRSSKDAVPKDRAVGDGRVFNSFNGYQRSGALPFGVLVP